MISLQHSKRYVYQILKNHTIEIIPFIICFFVENDNVFLSFFKSNEKTLTFKGNTSKSGCFFIHL